jgi:hypothetical protein
MLKTGGNQDNYFVKFEHTKFSDQNKKAMALLIILLDRKNLILKNLAIISTQRQQLQGQGQKQGMDMINMAI